MPPKKVGSETPGKFTWDGPNDNKLLLLTQGRYVKPDEYVQLSSAFPGTTTGSIRNRISALRVKQRDLYETLNWSVPEGSAGHSVTIKSVGAKGVKRGKVESEDGGDEEAETPSKKKTKTPVKEAAGGGRDAKKMKNETVVEDDDGGDDEMDSGPVKEKEFDEDKEV